MKGASVATIYVNEQGLMVQDDHVVHYIKKIPPIEPCTMCLTLPRLANRIQCPINEPFTFWQFLQMHP
jgi:hypothetical protein